MPNNFLTLDLHLWFACPLFRIKIIIPRYYIILYLGIFLNFIVVIGDRGMVHLM